MLARNGGGAIANLASAASFVNFALLASYSASKAAVRSLTQATRVMLRGQGTQVSAVYPGPIDTRMAADISRDKTSPADAAGAEEIFPDPMGQSLGSAYLASPKPLERQVAAMGA